MYIMTAKCDADKDVTVISTLAVRGLFVIEKATPYSFMTDSLLP